MAATYKPPPDPKRMLKTSRTYNTSLSAISIPHQIKRQLPAWYHLGADDNPRGFNRQRAPQCLKQHHNIRTVGDLIRTTKRLCIIDPDDAHKDLQDCTCNPCIADRNRNCLDP